MFYKWFLVLQHHVRSAVCMFLSFCIHMFFLSYQKDTVIAVKENTLVSCSVFPCFCFLIPFSQCPNHQVFLFFCFPVFYFRFHNFQSSGFLVFLIFIFVVTISSHPVFLFSCFLFSLSQFPVIRFSCFPVLAHCFNTKKV